MAKWAGLKYMQLIGMNAIGLLSFFTTFPLIIVIKTLVPVISATHIQEPLVIRPNGGVTSDVGVVDADVGVISNISRTLYFPL
jgi:hypothetical protein